LGFEDLEIWKFEDVEMWKFGNLKIGTWNKATTKPFLNFILTLNSYLLTQVIGSSFQIESILRELQTA
jgi:hypothetical protein